MTGESEEIRKLTLKIARIFDDVRTSHATHNRKLKELAALRSSAPAEFLAAFCKALTPLFNIQRRTAAAERIVKFASVFAFSHGAKGDHGDEFLENFLKFLLSGAVASDKTTRFRACQIFSEIIMRLPDDAEVSSELWDEVIECMMLRAGDKVPAVRTFAVRALARFANDSENNDILELFLDKLELEQNGEVRKIIVMSLPPSSATISLIIDSTLDVSESVRKAAYCVLASKYPLQSLSIKFRTTILQRGLTDRSTAVAKECLKMMKEEWLDKCCNGNPIELLKFLDVETYESVGESVMSTLLKGELVKLQDGQTIRMFFKSDGDSNHSIELMDAEVSLFWRMVCKHLHTEAHKKGSDAAMTMGTESAVYAEEASDKNDLLDSILPDSISQYVALVNAHIAAGPSCRFVSRQLLLLGAMLDFSDASNRKVASEFVQSLLHKALDHEVDDNGNEVLIGDGFNLGGERDWASAVAELAKRVHSGTREFEEVVLGVVEELARPCRERTAEFKQWLHCLAVVALLLENTASFSHMKGMTLDPTEILHSLLLPGAKHSNLDVQRASIRCIGLFGLLERKPSEDIVKQLRLSFVKGPHTVSIMSAKALLDLGLWHGPDEMDKAMNRSLSSELHDKKTSISQVEFSNGGDDLDIALLDLLFAGLENDWGDFVEVEDNQSIHGILGEGLAKILLLSNKFPGSHVMTHHLLLAKLVCLYFNSEKEEHHRLKQCLSVFFEHYPSLSANHKSCISKAFIPAIRSLWPGIDGNAAGSTVMISNMRKRAVQASRFMLQMMQVPLFVKETTKPDGEKSEEDPPVNTDTLTDFESGEEGLAIRLAVEVSKFPTKKSAAEKSYVAALSRILILLQFRVSEQEAVKLMRRVLNRVIVSVSAEKDVVKELRLMSERLQAIDGNPDEKLSPDQTNLILEKLELSMDLDEEGDVSVEVPPTPAAPQSTRRNRARRRVREEDESSSEDEEIPPASVGPAVSRSQRASKTAAMTRMTAKPEVRIDEEDDEEEEDVEDDEEGSDVTSEESFE